MKKMFMSYSFTLNKCSALFLNNLTEEDFANNIPKYLFREKNLIGNFQKINI